MFLPYKFDIIILLDFSFILLILKIFFRFVKSKLLQFIVSAHKVGDYKNASFSGVTWLLHSQELRGWIVKQAVKAKLGQILRQRIRD